MLKYKYKVECANSMNDEFQQFVDELIATTDSKEAVIIAKKQLIATGTPKEEAENYIYRVKPILIDKNGLEYATEWEYL